MNTIETCKDRVIVATRGLSAADIDAIAEHHYRTGDSVYHSVHVVLATPRCRCWECKHK